MKVIKSIRGSKYDVLNTDTDDSYSSSLKNLVSSDEEIAGLIKKYNIAFPYYDAVTLYNNLKLYILKWLLLNSHNDYTDLTDVIDKFMISTGRGSIIITEIDFSRFHSDKLYNEFKFVYSDTQYFKKLTITSSSSFLDDKGFENFLTSSTCRKFGLNFIFNTNIKFTSTITTSKGAINRVLLDIYSTNCKLVSKLNLDYESKWSGRINRDYFIRGIFFDKNLDDLYYCIGCFNRNKRVFMFPYMRLYFKDLLNSKFNIEVIDTDSL